MSLQARWPCGLSMPFSFFADTVTLSLNNKCGGTLSISVNNISHDVCGTDWTKENTDVVCRELNCGKVSHQKPMDPSVVRWLGRVQVDCKPLTIWEDGRGFRFQKTTVKCREPAFYCFFCTWLKKSWKWPKEINTERRPKFLNAAGKE